MMRKCVFIVLLVFQSSSSLFSTNKDKENSTVSLGASLNSADTQRFGDFSTELSVKNDTLETDSLPGGITTHPLPGDITSDPIPDGVITDHLALESLTTDVLPNVTVDSPPITDQRSLNTSIPEASDNAGFLNATEYDDSIDLEISRRFGQNGTDRSDFVPVFFPMAWAWLIKAGWTVKNYNITDTCSFELHQYVQDLRKRKIWATTLYDATGKQGPGLLKGSVTWHGNYDQCRNVRYSMTSNGSDVTRLIQGHYCSLTFSSPLWLEQYANSQNLPFPVKLPYITVDICIPSGCKVPDITTIIEAYDGKISENYSLVDVNCHEDLVVGDDPAAVFSIFVLALIGCMVFLGTIITIIAKLTTPKGEVKDTQHIGYFSKRGSIFSVARQNSILYRHHSTRRGSVHRGNSIYSKRSSSLSRQESMKPSLNNNSPSSPSPATIELMNEIEKRGDIPPSPGVRVKEFTFTEGAAADKPQMRRESLILQNGSLEPIKELATSPPVLRSMSTVSKVTCKSEDPTEVDGKRKIGGVLTDMLLCFSFPNNVTAVLGEGNTNHLFCLSGIRFLSISWIVMGNTLSFIHKAPDAVENSVVGVELAQSLWFQMIINSTFAADTFFVLSGTLLSYNFMRGVNKKKAEGTNFKVTPKFLIMFYLHRLIRITPCYYIAVMTFTNLLPYMGHGPRWKYVSGAVDQCKDHWWANVFFFSNFYKADDMCMGWTYYLVNDFQFYLISPLILIPLVRLPKLGFGLLGALIATQIISVGVLNNKINGNMLRMDNGYFSEVYAKPYCRVGVWAIGVILGYILNRLGRKIYLRKLPLITGWTVSVLVMTCVVYITYLENRVGGSQWTGAQTALYEALSRPAWGLAVAWLIFACSIGQGGYIHKFLSWNFFLPLCRITYGIYLLHPLVIVVVIDTSRNLLYLSPIDLWLNFVPILITATMFALVLIVCVEGPFIRLEKLVRTIAS